MTSIIKKKCNKCGVVKPLAEFRKNSYKPDGHQGTCRQCKKRMWSEKKRGLNHVELNSVGILAWTQIESVLREMAELQAAVDLETIKHNVQSGKIKREQDGKTETLRSCQKDMIDAVKRANEKKAELQKTIESEKELYAKRLIEAKQNYKNAIENHQIRLRLLESMLKEYFKENAKKLKTADKDFRFGSISYNNGKFEVSLKADYAAEMIDKP